MKRTLITMGVFTAVLCTLAFTPTGQGPISKIKQMVSTADKPVEQSVTTKKAAKEAFKIPTTINEASLKLASQLVPNSVKPMKAPADDALAANEKLVVEDLWNMEGITIAASNGATFDQASNTIGFAGQENIANYIIYGGDSDGNVAWQGESFKKYTFSGKVQGDGAAIVQPCVIYMKKSATDDGWYFGGNKTIDLNEENNYTSEFTVDAYLPEDCYVAVCIRTNVGTQGRTFKSTNNKFTCTYKTLMSEKWTQDNDKPGLGITEDIADNAYTILCADGLTTLGLYLDGDQLCVTGINTTAANVTMPMHVSIDGKSYMIKKFGRSDLSTFDWSGAQSVTNLDLSVVSEVNLLMKGSAVTDLTLSSIAAVNSYSDLENVYLHLPYGAQRSSYSYMGFKRVLIGDEQPSYPEPSDQDCWVIAGDREGEYFSIQLYDSRFRVVEIFSQEESVTLPEVTPYAGGRHYFMSGVGYTSSYNNNNLWAHAPNLRSISLPKDYDNLYIYWSNSPIKEVHLKNNMALDPEWKVPTTNWSLPSDVTVYIDSQEAYNMLAADGKWSSAILAPEGWDFEWMAVSVARKGEFAQTYIEMTDADWSKGINVKVIGELNDTDLANLKKLTQLRNLDLSDATFDALPQSFLSNNNTLNEITLPENIKIIPSSAFNYCKNLRKVHATGLNRINESAFNECRKLTDIDISDVVVIERNAFCYCEQFAPAELPVNMNFLGPSAFYGTGVKEVVIPNNVLKIGNQAFAYCKKLRKVTMHDAVSGIGSEAFEYCPLLAEINIPEAVTFINDEAFLGCTSLTEITLPSNLESLGSSVFQNCNNLTTIKCKAVTPPATSGNFTNGMDLNHCTLYVAPFTIDAYRAANNWKDFYIMKPLNEPVKNIYVKRPMTFDLMSEDNAVLQDNPNMLLGYNATNNSYNNYSTVGQLSASGDGTLSAGVFKIYNVLYDRNTYINSNSGNYYSYDMRPTLINNAENMRADSVVCIAKLEKNTWHFISFQYDVQMKDIYGRNGTDFVIRQYNSEKRAAAKAEDTGKSNAPMYAIGTGGKDDGTTVVNESNWEDVPADGVLVAGKGYIIQAANNNPKTNGETYDAVVEFPSRNTVTKNRLFTSADIIVPLEEYPAEFAHNRSWNLVGNPYPCYFDMHSLKDDFYTPIVLWNGSSYQAYSPVDDGIILRPNEAFFVQRPIDVEQMVFGTEGRMHYNDALAATYNNTSKPGVKYAPARSINGAERNVFNFTLEGCGSDNRARIVMNEKATMGYDLDRDAAKFFASTPMGAEIYVDGDVKYDICERPLAEGTAKLAMRVATAGEYTITLSGKYAEGWTVMLTDTQTGATVDLGKDAYRFEAAAGTTAGRFVLSFKAPAVTAIDAIDAEIDANAEVSVVNASGMTVYKGRIADFKAKATAGVYVVVCGDKTYKTVIK